MGAAAQSAFSSKPNMPLWNIEPIRQGKKPAWNYVDGGILAYIGKQPK